MQGIPIVKVDPALPVCENCQQNVVLDGGVIEPHGLKYNTLGPPEAMKVKNKKTGKEELKQVRHFVVGTAYCRMSNRPFPGAVITKVKEQAPLPVYEEEIPPEDALLDYLFENPNMGYSARDLAYVCEIRENRTGKLDTHTVDKLLKRQQRLGMPDGYTLRHIEVTEGKEVWAMVVKK